jgi:hypothetical protein
MKILEYSNDGLAWNTLSNFSGSYNDLSDKPTIPSDTNQLAKTDVYTKIEVNDLMISTGITIGTVEPSSGWWFEEID